MKKVIIIIIMLIILVTACADNTIKKTDVDNDNINNDILENTENIKKPDLNDDIDRTEYLTGEIITDGIYDHPTNHQENIYFVPDDEATEVKRVSSGDIAFEGDRLFYLNKNSQLYSVKNNGTDKKIIFDKYPINSFQIYEDKIYMLHFDFSADNPSTLFYSNMDGTNSNELKLGLEFSDKYYISQFVISKDLLFFVVYDFTKTNDVDFPKQFFMYNLEDGDLTILYEDSVDAFGKLVINDSILYSLGYGPREYDVLNKYNIETKDKSAININNNSHVENFITSKLYFEDDLIYYSGKTYIDVDNINGLTDTKTLFEDIEFMIVTMAKTKEYIFFVNLDDLRKYDTDSEIMNLDIYRINIEGSEISKIYTETMNNTNLPPGALSIAADDVIIYRNNLTDNILVMDLEGNVLDWNL